MNKYSDNKDSSLTTRTGKVDYELTELTNGCDHPKCNTRRQYGIKVKKKRTDYIMNSISIVTYTSTKNFCPKHRPDTSVTDEALDKEHEQALNEWKEIKKERRKENYNNIVQSDLIPIFRYNSKIDVLSCRQTDRFLAENFVDLDEVIEFLDQSRLNIPVVIEVQDKNNLYILHPYRNTDTEKYSIENKMIDFDDFKERFGDFEYKSRELFTIRSNILTGTDYKETPVKDLESLIDNVVEWHEYINKKGHLNPHRCPACGDSVYSRNVNYSRVIIDGETKIIATHKKCSKIMGELNLLFIDKDSYELN